MFRHFKERVLEAIRSRESDGIGISRMAHKKQHWIPQSYLKAWCDPSSPLGQEPYVWLFSKSGESVRKTAPKNIFFGKDLYTIRLADGTRDLTVEHGLAGLEDAFVRVRNEKLATRAALSPDEHLLLRAFIGAMQARTPAHIEHWRGQWKRILGHMEKLSEEMLAKTPEEQDEIARVTAVPSRAGRSLDYEEVEELSERSGGRWVVAMVQRQLPVLSQMTLSVLTTSHDLGFVTSDMPCVWFDPEGYKRPALFRGPGLAFATIEITLPASYSQMLLLSWHPLKEYIDASEAMVDELNRRTRFYCHEYFIVRRKEKRDVWFDPGKPPE